MKVYLDVYNEVKEALPWATEDQLRILAYKNWKAQNEEQPIIKVEAPNVERSKKKQAQKNVKSTPMLYPMPSEGCKRVAHSNSNRKFKLCEGRKIRHTFICSRCGIGRSFGYITPYGLLCPRCAAKNVGGHSVPHCYTTPMRD